MYTQVLSSPTGSPRGLSDSLPNICDRKSSGENEDSTYEVEGLLGSSQSTRLAHFDLPELV